MDLTGQQAELTFTVADADTAQALGSGDLAVLATPRLLAWCEAATCAAVAEGVAEGSTTVGSRADLEHRVPSAVGRRVTVHATVAGHEGRHLRFEVWATHDDDEVVGRGIVERVVVDAHRFMAGLG